MRRAGLLCIAALGLFPATAQASITFGSDLTLPADSLSSQCAPISPPCSILQFQVHDGNAFPATAPVAGLLTSFGIKAGGGETVTFRLGRTVPATANSTGRGTGPTVSLKGPGTYSFPASLWVHAGDSVGLDFSSAASFTTQPYCYMHSHSWWYSPPLVDGAALRSAGANGACEWLVNATYTPSPRGLALLRCTHRRKVVRKKCRKRARKLPVLPS
jgi:hypothetical protein